MSAGFEVTIRPPEHVQCVNAEDGSIELVEVIDWRLEGRNIVLVLEKRVKGVRGDSHADSL